MSSIYFNKGVFVNIDKKKTALYFALSNFGIMLFSCYIAFILMWAISLFSTVYVILTLCVINVLLIKHYKKTYILLATISAILGSSISFVSFNYKILFVWAEMPRYEFPLYALYNATKVVYPIGIIVNILVMIFMKYIYLKKLSNFR